MKKPKYNPKNQTCEEMYNSGFLENGRVYVERYYVNRCKKVLGMKFKYRTRHFRLLKFKGLGDDDRYRFDVLMDSNYYYNPIQTGHSYSSGTGVKLDLVSYTEEVFSNFRFKEFRR